MPADLPDPHQKDRQTHEGGDVLSSGSQTPVVIPGPTRVVLVDTKISPGRNIEIPLDNNTLITGRNAAGKTSVIQLMPLFLGESPNKVSDKNQNKHFIPYYLPHDTSYIAFEYIHRGGQPRSVIIHASADGKELRYRFVRSALYADMFETDAEEYVPSGDLARHLRLRGYTFASEAVTTLWEYRAIMQGHRPREVSNDKRRTLDQMTADYALGYSKTPLTNMERVVSSMLKKKSSLPQLEAMIATKILGDDAVMKFGTGDARLSDWPDQYRAYQTIMEQEEDVRLLQATQASLKSTVSDIIACYSEISAIKASKERSLANKKHEKASVEEASRIEISKLEEEKETARKDHVAAKHDRKALETSIKDISDRKNDYDKNGMEAKDAFARTRPQLKQDAATLRQKIDAKTGDHDKLTSRYNKMKEDERTAARKQIEVHEAEIGAIETQGREDLAEQATIHASDMRALEEHNRTKLEEQDEIVSKAALAEGLAKHEVDNPQAPKELTDLVERASEENSIAQKKLTEALDKKNEANAKLAAALSAREKADKDQKANSQKIDAAEARLNKLEAFMEPAPGSVLDYLRREIPEWEGTIAKVINPDLLERKDLSPGRAEAGVGIYGLTVELENLQPTAASNLEQQRRDHKALLEEIDGYEAAGETLAKAANEAYSTHAAATTELERASNGVATARRKAGKAEADLSAAKQSLKTARENAVSIARTRLETAEAKHLAAKQERDEARRNCQASVEELRKKQGQERSDKEGGTQNSVAAQRESIGKIKTRLKETLEGLDRDLAADLEAKGVDAEELKRLEDERSAIMEKLEQIEKDREALAEWSYFMKNEHTKLPKLNSELLEAKLSETRCAEKYDGTLEAIRLANEKTAAKVEALSAEIRTLSEDIANAEKALARNEYRLPDDLPETRRTLAQVIRDLNELVDEHTKAARKFDQDVRTVRTTFMNRPETAPSDYILSHTSHAPGETQATMNALVKWFDEEHMTHRELLVTQGRTMTNAIKAAYHKLRDVDDSIQRENRRLQASLTRNNDFDVVDEIGITISSTIKSIEGFPLMKTLSDLHDDWDDLGEEPPEGYLEAMKNMVPFLTSGREQLIDLRKCIRLHGYVIENGTRRPFHAKTDLSDVSSNGVSYLVLLTIFVGFINMVRGEKNPVRVVWALDELSDIDATNTRKLLEMLERNHITMIAATPSAEASVRRLFDYRLQVTSDRRLQNVEGATMRRLGLIWSKDQENAPSAMTLKEEA